MRSLLIIAACLCAPLTARAQDAAPPVPQPQQQPQQQQSALPDGTQPTSQKTPRLPYVPGDQNTFNIGAEAFDAGDYPNAFAIFSKLADNYDVGAMRNVAIMERQGLGTPKNPKAAQAMMERAARTGLPTAEADLGVMLMDGEAGSPDEKAALPWLMKAVQAQHPIAQYRLGELFEEGAVVPKNMQIAELLYGAAARHGVIDAANRLMKLKGWTELPQGFMDGPDPEPLVPVPAAAPSP